MKCGLKRVFNGATELKTFSTYVVRRSWHIFLSVPLSTLVYQPHDCLIFMTMLLCLHHSHKGEEPDRMEADHAMQKTTYICSIVIPSHQPRHSNNSSECKVSELPTTTLFSSVFCGIDTPSADKSHA